MCWADDAESPEFYWDRMQKARHAHKCGECFRTIEPREEYERVTGKWDGYIGTHKTCAHCLAARTWLSKECGGFVFGSIYEELVEHWRDDTLYRTMWLARTLHSMKRNWKFKSGELMPVPENYKRVPLAVS